MPEFETADLTERERARIVKTAVSPRPIAWVGTTSPDGVDNLAPYSSYNYVSSAEPVVVFNSPNADHGGLKDSARNALDTEEFTVSVVTEPLLETMDATAERLGPEESEFDAFDVERAPSKTVTPPRVADALVSMECTLHDAVEVHDRLMVLGDVTRFHVADDALVDGKIDSQNVPTVGRLGGPFYTASTPLPFERQN
ncbi:flavin reductase family protein [Halocalculus aciditolerans]|uniref:Flavin reductase like domain-containing protein n=1 Tax=Halocalculus aciditolerans TaxID=1383812 RepID=A0A830FFJ1_9EURY|nr:flavin reductase family protein [Halocalculus aciditolerans]GGL50393.1 hypothetical protein GCM10009039_05670 [Halocalculus aciditolerans]